MLRIILGIIGGFIAWSIFWAGSDQIFRSIWPDSYGAHQFGLERAMTNNEPFATDAGILLISIFRSIVITIMSGFLAAVISKENWKAPVALGILLLLFGVFVQAVAWNYLPVWYHLLFLLMLVPMTILGGKMKSTP
ncbi:MAG: hypothetical protein LC734_05225 [Acidobacteria bacterium]|nr:hypothetical protein [Acidobacteriota bacterium]